MSPQTTKRQRLEKLKRSTSYLRAYEDLDFIHREDLRPIRLQLELLKPELLQNEYQIESTIVVFGSARIPSPEDGKTLLEEARAALAKNPADTATQQRVRIAERHDQNSKYYEEAQKFASIVSSACQDNSKREFVIVTGGGPGIMEAANRGAYEVGATSIGLNITLPHEQEPNSYITPELCFLFHYFAVRKMHFLLRSKAIVCFPGGFGTLDELFETLTLVQNEKMEPLPIVLFGRTFWDRAVNLDFLVDEGVISQEDLALIHYVETAEEAWDYIVQRYGGIDAMRKAMGSGAGVS